jgi:hypothetical protein
VKVLSENYSSFLMASVFLEQHDLPLSALQAFLLFFFAA